MAKVKVGDWVIVRGLSDYKDFEEGQVTRIHGDLAEISMVDIGVKWTLNVKYLYKVDKGISRQQLIDIALDLKDKQWFMELTSK